MVTWVELRDNNNPAFNFVVHEHALGPRQRRRPASKSATLMRQKIRELASGIPVILTGDFNADQGGDRVPAA